MSFNFQMLETPSSAPDGYTPLVADSPGMYQLSNFGMSLVAELMDRAGLLDTQMEEPDLDEFWPPKDIEEERAEDVLDALEFGEEPDPPLTEYEKASLAEYDHKQEVVLAVTSPVESKVPAFKFASNDGWFVVPEECRAIAYALRNLHGDDVRKALGGPLAQKIGVEEARKTLEEWISYNRVAADYGGYRVF